MITADTGTNLTIRRTAVSGGQTGIRVDSGSHITVVDSDITGKIGTGIHIGQMGVASLQGCAIAVARGIGINVRATGRCEGERCSINIANGLWVRGDAGARVELSRCSLSGERVGIHIGRYASGIMSDCSILADREISLIADPHGALSLQRSALQEGTGSRATIKRQGNVVTAPQSRLRCVPTNVQPTCGKTGFSNIPHTLKAFAPPPTRWSSAVPGETPEYWLNR